MSTDVDSDDSKLIYKLIQMPESGRLHLNKNGIMQQLTIYKPYNIFTQTDIDKGRYGMFLWTGEANERQSLLKQDPFPLVAKKVECESYHLRYN